MQITQIQIETAVTSKFDGLMRGLLIFHDLEKQNEVNMYEIESEGGRWCLNHLL